MSLFSASTPVFSKFFSSAILVSLITANSIFATSESTNVRESVDLSGEWLCALDPSNVGETKQWAKNFPAVGALKAILPGSLDTNHIGMPTEEHTHKHLGKELNYEGPAWFQKTVMVPESFEGRKVTLELERTKVTSVWINGTRVGSSRLVYAPQFFDVSKCIMAGGPNVITICVDNTSSLVPLDGSHAYSPDTQSNWNGIIGEMSLTALSPIHINAVRVESNLDLKQFLLKVELSNGNKESDTYIRAMAVPSLENESNDWELVEKNPVDPESDFVELAIDLGPAPRMWSAQSTELYRIVVQYGKLDPNGEWQLFDATTLTTGFREFKATPEGFTINGHRTFLRGKHDACVFPLTGYPAMDVEGWIREFAIAKQYGINHYRFHTFTPPEAAFEAADQMGIYIQAELPIWWGFDDTDEAMISYLVDLGKAITDAYGNHPSLVLFALGNEISKEREVLKRMVQELRAHDPRHLYAQGSNNRLWDPSYAEGDDFWRSFRTGVYTEDGRYDARLSMSYLDSNGEGGLLNSRYPSTTVNFDAAMDKSPVPFLGFEVGQYQVFPSFKEIPKYQGVLKPYNLEIYRERLKEAGMLDQAEDFFLASGALSVLGYRADIEAMLRTQRYAGFDLLDLQDYPGQGTALVGILDAFMDNKGLIRPDQFREFCNETVLLLEQPKFSWTKTETYQAAVSISNFSADNYSNGSVEWELRACGNLLKSGEIKVHSPGYSGLTRIQGAIEFAMKDIQVAAPSKLELRLHLKGTRIKNSYPLWIYPADLDTKTPPNIIETQSLDHETLAQLQGGAKVILFPEPEDIESFSTPNQFISEFWNWEMFTGFAKNSNGPVSAGTNGLLLDPRDPLFESFPTESHTNFQWWPIVTYSRALILDSLPSSYRPKVQVIDSISRMHRLGMVCEFKVGEGSLLVCTSQLKAHMQYPEVRQFYQSLVRYMDSPAFDPAFKADTNTLETLGLLKTNQDDK